jgi:carbonic anhydrase/acetyltransferase-like protein (isoleucine patch superfamily)
LTEPAPLPGQPTAVDPGVLIGYPVSGTDTDPLVLGPGARLRSGTVLHDGTTVGRCLRTGHGVVVREACRIGDDVSIWSDTVVDYGCRIGVIQKRVVADSASASPYRLSSGRGTRETVP